MKREIISALLRAGHNKLCNAIAAAPTIADYQDGTHVGLFIRAPESIARQRPPLEDDTSPPHVTVLYIGELPERRRQDLLGLTRAVVGGVEPFAVRLADDVSYFPPSQHSDAKKVAKLEILDGPGRPLHRCRQRLWDGFKAAGFPFKDHWPEYRPHMTLGYIDERDEYRGPIPSGQWVVRGLDVWGWYPDDYVAF